MDKKEEIVEVLERLIIEKANSMKSRNTSPAEIAALAELVAAFNRIPRTLVAKL